MSQDDHSVVKLDEEAGELKGFTEQHHLLVNGANSKPYEFDEVLGIIGFGWYQIRLLFICGLGWMADNMWASTISLIIPVVQLEWGISDGLIALLPAADFSGMLVGGLLWGYLSDLIGRKPAFMWTLMISAIFGIAACFSPNYWVLLGFVFFMGSGVGGNMPVDGAMFAEFITEKLRGRLMVLLSLFWILGSSVASGLAWALLPKFSCDKDTPPCYSKGNRGWRYLVGAVGLINLSMFLVRIGLHESPLFLYKTGKIEESKEILKQLAKSNGKQDELPDDFELVVDVKENTKKKPTLELLKMILSKKMLFTTILLWGIWLFTNWSYTEFNAFLPKYLQGKHLATSEVYRDSFIYAAAGVPGSLLGAWLVDTFLGRRFTMAPATLMSGIAMFLFLISKEQWKIILFTCIINATSQVMYAATYTYTPEIYPTEVRSTAVGICAGFGRFASIFAPIATGWLLSVNQKLPLYIAAGTMGVGSLFMAILPYETRGKKLG